jgi:hypothetical protein
MAIPINRDLLKPQVHCWVAVTGIVAVAGAT